MFKSQQNVLDFAPALVALLAKYEQPTAWVDASVSQTRGFIVPVPLLGAFSAGKSTLLNAYLETPLFATSLDPETAVPAQLSYGTEESILGCRPDRAPFPLTRDTVRDNALQALLPDGWVEAQMPSPRLKAVPHLRLVDMPGWDSGLSAHQRAIDSFAGRSLGYVLVVSVDEGSLRRSIRDALRELEYHKRPVAVVISKSDKKAPEDVQAVRDTIVAEVTAALGSAPASVAVVSARKKEVEPFVRTLAALEQMAEPLFVETVCKSMQVELKRFHEYLVVRAEAGNLSGDEITSRLRKISADLEAFDRKLARDTEAFERRAMAALDRIAGDVSAALMGNAESLAGQAANGTDISGQFGTIVRLAVARGYEQYFRPELEQYCKEVDHALPPQLVEGMRAPSGLPETSTLESIGGTLLSLAPLIAPLLVAIPVIGPILAPTMRIILPLLTVLGGKAAREAMEARRLDSIRASLVNEIIPNAVAQTREGMKSPLQDTVMRAKETIQASVGAQRDVQISALEQARADQARQQAEYEALREQFVADASQVSAMLNELGGIVV